MSDQTIRKGDLVIVTHSCCGDFLGYPFEVGRVMIRAPGFKCDTCGAINTNVSVFATPVDPRDGHLCNWPVNWLTKINPPPITQETEREVTV